jgi:hypothetical protein
MMLHPRPANTPRWPLPRGNALVPSAWQATPDGPASPVWRVPICVTGRRAVSRSHVIEVVVGRTARRNEVGRLLNEQLHDTTQVGRLTGRQALHDELPGDQQRAALSLR